VTKKPEKNNLKEEGFIFAHSFKGFGPWSLGSVFGACTTGVHHGGKV
jgi:hypothetical protein